LREEVRIRASGNREKRRISGHMREKVREGWRNGRNAEIHGVKLEVLTTVTMKITAF
jgi:hypothetical protein